MTNETIRNTQKITLGQAAQLYNVSKSTLSRDLKKGKLSAEKDDEGAWQIDQAELARHYKPRNSETSAATSVTEQSGTPEKHPRNSALEREVELLREMLDEVKADRDSWREQSGKWEQQAQQLLLMAPTKKADTEATSEPRKGFWSRFFFGG